MITLILGFKEPEDRRPFEIYRGLAAGSLVGNWQKVEVQGEEFGDLKYRFRVTKDADDLGFLFVAGDAADTDGDQLSDTFERLVSGTRHDVADSDRDGLSDKQEIDAGTDPLEFGVSGTPALFRESDQQQFEVAETRTEIVVRVEDAGVAMPGAPVRFVASGGGLLYASASSSEGGVESLESNADDEGLARAYLQPRFAGGSMLNNVAAGTYASPSKPGGRGAVSVVDFSVWPAVADAIGETALARMNAADLSGDTVDTWPNRAEPTNPASVEFGASAGAFPRTGSEDGIAFVEFDGVDDGLTFVDTLATESDEFSVFALYQPEATHVPRSPSVKFGHRLAGLSGQRYLLSGMVETGGDPWPDPTPLVATDTHHLADTVFSIWRRFAYSERWTDDFDLRRDYDPREPKLEPLRTPHLPTGFSLRLDGTADGFFKMNVTVTEGVTLVNDSLPDTEANPVHPLAPSETVRKNIDMFGAAKRWEWELQPILPELDVMHLASDPFAPDYTLRYDRGRPVDTEERFYTLKPVRYLHPDRKLDSKPESKTAVGKVGLGLSVASNGIGAFELRDGNSSVVEADRSMDEFYPSMAALASGGTSGWRVLSAVWDAGKVTLTEHSSSGLRSTLGIDSESNERTGFDYIGAGGGVLSGNRFRGRIAQLVVLGSVPGSTAARGIVDQLISEAQLPWDRDGNEIDDAWEFQFLFARRTAGGWSAGADPDLDGWTNLEEFNERERFSGNLGTHPAITDSDGDGIADREEADGSTDPTSADSDGDGFTDGFERDMGESDGAADGNANGIPDGWEAFSAAG